MVIYVDDVKKSTAFYTKLLEKEPVEVFEEFAVFQLIRDFILGIQAKAGIDPKPQPRFGGFEICVADATEDEVDVLYKKWKELGVSMALEPTNLTFVAVDPDGHRLRVCAQIPPM